MSARKGSSSAPLTARRPEAIQSNVASDHVNCFGDSNPTFAELAVTTPLGH